MTYVKLVPRPGEHEFLDDETCTTCGTVIPGGSDWLAHDEVPLDPDEEIAWRLSGGKPYDRLPD
jgi:hypothetical protein